MFEKILVHLDPSRPQRRARQVAADLARRMKAELLALYVVDERALMGAEAVHAVQDAFTAIAEQSLSDYGEELGEDLPLGRLIGYGDTAKTIAHYMRREGADLVVTGGFHMSAYERVPFGSVVNDIIRRVHSNVLLVRDYHKAPMPGAPIVQAFGPNKSSVKGLYMSADLARAYESPLIGVHVSQRSQASLGETQLMGAMAHQEKVGVPLTVERLEKRRARAGWRPLVEASERHNAGFLVVGRDYHVPAFWGTVSPVESLVVHTKTPLLVQWDE